MIKNWEKCVEGVSWHWGHHLFDTLSALITQKTPINEAQTKEMKRFVKYTENFLFSVYLTMSEVGTKI